MMRSSLVVLAGSAVTMPAVAQGEQPLRTGTYEVRYTVGDML